MKKEIQKYRVYTPAEASDSINVSHPLLLKEIDKGALQAKLIGKGWKILGINLINYIRG
jgi:hypothetical protein